MLGGLWHGRSSAHNHEWLRKVQVCGSNLQHAPQHILRDFEVVLHAVENCPDAIRYASPDLQSDPDIKHAYARGLGQQLPTDYKVCASKRFGLAQSSSSFSAKVLQTINRSSALKDLQVYNPDMWSKGFCGPSKSRITDKSWPCRGGHTCRKKMCWSNGTPTSRSCWRYAYQQHIEIVKQHHGFLLQIVELGEDGNLTLGHGQVIEEEMALEARLPIIQILQGGGDFEEHGDEFREFLRQVASWRVKRFLAQLIGCVMRDASVMAGSVALLVMIACALVFFCLYIVAWNLWESKLHDMRKESKEHAIWFWIYTGLVPSLLFYGFTQAREKTLKLTSLAIDMLSKETGSDKESVSFALSWIGIGPGIGLCICLFYNFVFALEDCVKEKSVWACWALRVSLLALIARVSFWLSVHAAHVATTDPMLAMLCCMPRTNEWLLDPPYLGLTIREGRYFPAFTGGSECSAPNTEPAEKIADASQAAGDESIWVPSDPGWHQLCIEPI